MASDYNKIGQNPRINYRKIFTPYSDKTHFVYELIQNADDNESECIELQLYENELIVWNDGDEFLEEDVHSICSIGFSNKDLTQIGTFGMGFSRLSMPIQIVQKFILVMSVFVSQLVIPRSQKALILMI